MDYDNQVTIGGKTYELAYPLGVVAIYQRVTTAIERSRPHEPAADPRCLCGSPKSAHVGPRLVRLGDDQDLLCVGFRLYDPLLGDNLFHSDTLVKAFPGTDTERFIALLWVGLHKYDAEKQSFVPPFPLEETGNLVGLADVAALFGKVISTVTAYFPKAQPGPNA